MSVNIGKQVLKQFLLLFLVGFLTCIIPPAEAFFSSHPLQDYQQGVLALDSYRGDESFLKKAQSYFTRIIQKHPDSPFGYLGMSQLKTFEAYRYGRHYNIKMITDYAMPMALKAMRYGPTIREVHTNYDRFEKIFSENDEHQNQVRKLLSISPEKPETYFVFADYLSDQGDFEKAVEYYKIALRFAADDVLKLKTLQRIAQIYLQELPDAKLAVKYYEEALEINPNMPSVWESLGRAYFQLQRYDLSAQNFKKALDIFETKELRSCWSHVERLVYQDFGQVNSVKNSQNTSLHCLTGNLYYTQDQLNIDVLHSEISQR